jgi:hypothetical protein
MIEMNLPVIDAENKAVIVTDNKLKALLKLVVEKGYDLDNVTAFFAPTRIVYEIHTAKNSILQAAVQERIDVARQRFIDVAEEYGVEYHIFDEYDQFTLENGDNLIGDVGRLDTYVTFLKLFEMRGLDLNTHSNVITSTRKVVFEFLDVTDKMEELGDGTHDYIMKNCPAILAEYPEFNHGADFRMLELFRTKAGITGLRTLIENDKVFFPFEDMLTVEVDNYAAS